MFLNELIQKLFYLSEKLPLDRTNGQIGYCQSDTNKSRFGFRTYVGRASHKRNCGSGTIFFSGCNLRCVFCQNYTISSENSGKTISTEHLSEIMLEQQARGVHNINLVTATHFIPSIVKAVQKAKNNGLKIPIVYNTGGI